MGHTEKIRLKVPKSKIGQIFWDNILSHPEIVSISVMKSFALPMIEIYGHLLLLCNGWLLFCIYILYYMYWHFPDRR